ncbi:MAG TPA: 2-amino-4-hydroxy-6-hydroxymethyldihydropteridine diphosphokinase, partial [Gammaproteobacteria bacterium]|nr:2-amino-4-hydroxy-6-hydroxymethyldihydropteridine diphosphokinase [Gammaproteobacteria bacterium]
MVRVVISVGTNIDRENNLKAALAALGRAYDALRMSP